MKKINVFYENWKGLIWLVFLMFILGLIGISCPWGNSKWNFIFENMVWFPVEIILTVFALNKIIERNELEKKRERSKRIIRNKDKVTIEFVRDKITAIMYSDVTYDEKRNDEELFKRLLVDIEEKQNKIINKNKLESMHRVYQFQNNSKKDFNYFGICQIQCENAFDELTNFMDRYHEFLETNVYIEMDKLRDLIYSLGMLSIVQ